MSMLERKLSSTIALVPLTRLEQRNHQKLCRNQKKRNRDLFSFFWTTSCSSKKMLAVTWHVSEMFRRFLLCFVLKPVKVNGRGISKPLLEMDSVTLRPFQTNGPPTRPWIMTLHSVVWLGSYILCHCCRSLRANLETNHLQSQWVL